MVLGDVVVVTEESAEILTKTARELFEARGVSQCAGA